MKTTRLTCKNNITKIIAKTALLKPKRQVYGNLLHVKKNKKIKLDFFDTRISYCVSKTRTN
jgi:hypothetical protein